MLVQHLRARPRPGATLPINATAGRGRPAAPCRPRRHHDDHHRPKCPTLICTLDDADIFLARTSSITRARNVKHQVGPDSETRQLPSPTDSPSPHHRPRPGRSSGST